MNPQIPTSIHSSRRAQRDPCLPIQIDLSSLIDGELEEAAVRRVLVHAEVCPACSSFLRAIRAQAMANAVLSSAITTLPGSRKGADVVPFGIPASRIPGAIDGVVDATAERLAAERLVHGRLRDLAEVFYQLGRAYVHLVVSPAYRRVVGSEPVPIPEFRLRGRALLDKVAENGVASAETNRVAVLQRGSQDWVRARSLLNGHLDSNRDNLAKGRNLLQEAVTLEPKHHSARIYLGHAHEVGGDGERARAEFERVLRATRSRTLRAFALENLGSSHMAAGQLDEATHCFSRLIASGVIEKERRFFTAYLNLAASTARAGQADACRDALTTLHTRFPEKRGWVKEQIATHERFKADLAKCPALLPVLKTCLPEWFVN